MTKVSVFGQSESKQLKQIQFVKRITSDGVVVNSKELPNEWENVMLYRGYDGVYSLDIILAWDDKGERAIYLGYWNDGVV